MGWIDGWKDEEMRWMDGQMDGWIRWMGWIKTHLTYREMGTRVFKITILERI